jgi:hypothetical protein
VVTVITTHSVEMKLCGFDSHSDFKRERDTRRVFKYPSKLNGAGTIHVKGYSLGNRPEYPPSPQVRIDFFNGDAQQVFEIEKTDTTTPL